MNKKTLKVLEYYKIIELLKNEADSDVGREIISELVPLKDPRMIEHALDEKLCYNGTKRWNSGNLRTA